MTEKGPTTTVSAKQMAMSRALGAALLSHQVEQLEKSVVARGAGAGAGRALAGNWRERRQQGGGGYRTATPQSQNQSKRAPPSSTAARSAPAAVGTGVGVNMANKGQQGRESPVSRRKLSDEEREFYHHGNGREGKDADVVVVDASVLVHALYQVKRWCREGRGEIVIVPLEALNTLDLLKKGTTSLAQRARAASRILEAQVGTNPRIRVQRDDAFVYWDKIAFSPTDAVDHPSDAAKSTTTTTATATTTGTNHLLPSPEWVRRTICCAKWESENPHSTLGDLATTNDNNPPRVLLAVLSPSSASPLSSPQSRPTRLSSEGSGETTAADNSNATPVVPLPAPPPGNKFEPRSAGTLVGHWAARAGIKIMEVEASAPGHGRVGTGRDDEDDVPRGGKAFRGHGHGHGGHGRRKISIGSGGMMVVPNGPGGGGSSGNSGMAGSTGLVERPPAVMAMMEMVSQPNKGRVVRVLARGEKLDP